MTDPDWQRCRTVLVQRLQDLGATIEIGESSPSPGKVVIARFEGKGECSILLMDHYDTVFSLGDAQKRPFRIEGSRAFGPGVADAKGGLAMILHALQILKDADFSNYKP
jgi:glutamate carboxypeptidase